MNEFNQFVGIQWAFNLPSSINNPVTTGLTEGCEKAVEKKGPIDSYIRINFCVSHF